MAYEDPKWETGAPAYQSNWVGAPQPAPSPLENLQAALRSGRINQVEYENAVRSLQTGIGGVRPEEFTPGYEGEITFDPPSQQRTISPQQPPPVAAQPQPLAVAAPQVAAPVQQPIQQPIQPAQQVAAQSTADVLAESMAAQEGGPPKAWQLRQRFEALEPGEQASLEKAGKQALPALAVSFASLVAAWPKTAKEKATEKTLEEYKPGQAGADAIRDYQQVTGSRADALGAQALDAIFAASAGQGLNTAARWTQNVRAAGQFYKDVAGAEQQALAQVYQGAEKTALLDYKDALGQDTAQKRRTDDALKKAEGLAAMVGKIQGSQATSVYKDVLKDMSPEGRAAFNELSVDEQWNYLKAIAGLELGEPEAPTAEAKEA